MRIAVPRGSCLLLAIVLAAQLFSAGIARGVEPTMRPAALRCAYLTDPLGIGEASPRLSWALEAVDAGARGLAQSAYRILAASKADMLAADQGDLWDTGRVTSPESIHHPYTGTPLVSGQEVFWKVMVWDADGVASAWSPMARFSMGLLTPQDWQAAQWIGAPEPTPAQESDEADNSPPIPASPLLRKQFEIAGEVARAMLYVTARGEYEFRLNGARVGNHQLAPEWTDYHKRIQYQTYDVSALVWQGANAAGATLADGWYAGRLGPTRWDAAYPRRGAYGLDRRLLAVLRIEFKDGSTTQVVTDGSWKVLPEGPLLSADHFLGETYDAQMERDGWDKPGFDDSAWSPVLHEPMDGVPIIAQQNEPIRAVAELRPVAITEPQAGVYLFDLGQNMVGWCRLRVSGLAGTEITLRHGEWLNPEGSLYVENLAAAVQTDRFLLRGLPEEVFEPRFTYHGFRYVEASDLPSPPTLDSLTGIVVASDAPIVGEFACSNPMIDQMVQNAFWTLRGNMHSVPTDCPQRDERMGWMGDAQVFAQSAVFTLDMGAFFTKWIQDIRDAQAKSGAFPDIAPHPYDPDARFNNAPGWADAGVIVPWRVYQNYADQQVLRAHFESARRYVDHLQATNPDLLWRNETGNHYGDWLNGDTIKAEDYPREGGQVPHEVFATAFFAYSANLVAEMARVLDETEDAARYRDLAAAVRAAFNTQFVAADGRISGDTQAGYALALHFDLLPEALRPKAVEHMIEGLRRYDGRISTGFQSTYRMLLELTRWGHNDLAYGLVESRRFPSWGYTIDQGATTIWERWDGYVAGRGFQDPGMNSFNHYAIGAVVEWIYRSIGGINPDDAQPGFKHFTLRPQPGGSLTWARARYRSIRGPIACSWKLDETTISMEVEIPPNTSATVYVPTSDAESVLEGGVPATDQPGLTFVRYDKGAALFEAVSGTYAFNAER